MVKAKLKLTKSQAATLRTMAESPDRAFYASLAGQRGMNVLSVAPLERAGLIERYTNPDPVARACRGDLIRLTPAGRRAA